MTYYCINCWHEINKDALICQHCGYDQSQSTNISFSEKLIKALKHVEPETPIRAASILGKLKVKEAIPNLFSRLEKEKDPFIIKSFVDALLMINPDLIYKIKETIGPNPPVTIKKILE